MNRHNRICVIFTGGTIGSAARDGVVGLSDGSASLLLDSYRARFGGGIEFECKRPLNVLSENIQPSDLEVMASCLKSLDLSRYDGVIITHGTDTLCFTANLFSQLFCDIETPVVFVSALYPLDDSRSNGLENFAAAVDFIRRASYGGVFVSFKNYGENVRIHLGGRLISAWQINGNYDSVKGVYFGEYREGAFYRNPDPLNPTEEELKKPRVPCLAQTLCMDLVTIQAHSLLNFDFYRFTEIKPRAVMVQLYHSGTVCTEGNKTNFINFLSYCRALGIEVVVAPIDSTAHIYSSAVGIEKLCTAAYDMSFEMATVKVLLALGSGVSIRSMLDENLFFEKLV